MEKVLSVKELCKTYIIKEYSNNVLRNVSFELNKGDFVSIMGPSGSGKSTLLYTVSGMDAMTSGSVDFGGRDLGSMGRKELSKLLKELEIYREDFKKTAHISRRRKLEFNFFLASVRAGADMKKQ